MHPARELAELGASHVKPCADVGKRLTTVGEQLRDMSEPSLGSFTEFALEPAPLLVRCLDDPAPVLAQLAALREALA